MRRHSRAVRHAAVAIVAAVLLSGCAPTYATPDDRSQARGAELAEAMTKIDPQPPELRVTANYGSARITMDTDDMTAAEIRPIVEQALQIFSESRISTLPLLIQIRHDQAGDGITSTPLDWWGCDPERTERYFTGMEVWLSVLADPALQLDEEFRVEDSQVYAKILVFDDRDIEAYRAEIVGVLEGAGYVDPDVYVELGE